MLHILERLFQFESVGENCCAPSLGFVFVLYPGQKAALVFAKPKLSGFRPALVVKLAYNSRVYPSVLVICHLPGVDVLLPPPWDSVGLSGISPKAGVQFSPVAGC